MTATDVFDADETLAQLENLVYSGSHDKAGRTLARLLQALRRGAAFSAEHVTDARRHTAAYTRLAAAMTSLLADPRYLVPDQDFDLLAIENSIISTIFAASGFASSNHLLQTLGTRDPSTPGKISFSSPANLKKLLLCYSLDSGLEIDFEALARQIPRYALPAFLGMLSEGTVMSVAAHRRRERLLRLGSLFEQMDLAEHMLLMLTTAYMMTSYATSEDKHAIKLSFNRLMRRFIESTIALPTLPLKRQIKRRPTVLLPIEWFNSTHAVYRIFAPSILQLKNRFRLIMIGHAMCMDESSKAHFDEVIELPNAYLPIADMVAHVRRINPDIILYPSVGMMMECVALSAVRLAPIQITMVGHPATTRSETMDYLLIDGFWPGDPGRFSETVMVQRPGSTAFAMFPNARFPNPQIRESPDVLNIAIASSLLKLNAPFLATIQSIARKARRRIQFHFFPSVKNLPWQRVSHEIRKWIPDAVVHPQCEYQDYLRNISRCDVHLSTFPFGGGNSNVDSMRLAIPMVALEGREPHEQIDAAMMRRVGYPEWPITRGPEEYERAALRLIENDAERIGIARRLAGADVVRLFTTVPAGVPDDEFLQVMTFVYQHHEAIQASGLRYWLPEDRQRLQASAGSGQASDSAAR